MPNIASASKRLRQNEVKNLYNRKIKSFLNTQKKKVIKSIESNDKALAMTEFKKYASALDKAARKSVIHSNRAAAKKSDMMKKINTMN